MTTTRQPVYCWMKCLLPKFNGAISTNLTWKGFTLNANFTFATGAMIYNGQRAGAIDRDCGRNSQPPMKLKDGWAVGKSRVISLHILS